MRKALIINGVRAEANGLPSDDEPFPKTTELMIEQADPTVGGLILSIDGSSIYIPYEEASDLFSSSSYSSTGVNSLNLPPKKDLA